MSRWAKILFLIVFLDAASTVLGLRFGYFDEEVNPIMAWFLRIGGLSLLFAVKIGASALFIGIIELIRLKKMVAEKKVRNYYIAAVAVYLAIYFAGIIAVNHTYFKI